MTVGGDIEMMTPTGTVRMARPEAYQLVAGSRARVAADYDLKGAEVSFRLGKYDPSLPLIIDPVLSYSTFLDDAFTLALSYGRAVYDCIYLALALLEQCELVTADRRFVRSLQRTAVSGAIVWLGDVHPIHT